MIGGRTFISKFTERRRTSSSEHHKLCLQKIFKKKASWDLIIHPEDEVGQAAVLKEANALLARTESTTFDNQGTGDQSGNKKKLISPFAVRKGGAQNASELASTRTSVPLHPRGDRVVQFMYWRPSCREGRSCLSEATDSTILIWDKGTTRWLDTKKEATRASKISLNLVDAVVAQSGKDVEDSLKVSTQVLTNAPQTTYHRMSQYDLINVGSIPTRIDERFDNDSHRTFMHNDHAKIKKADAIKCCTIKLKLIDDMVANSGNDGEDSLMVSSTVLMNAEVLNTIGKCMVQFNLCYMGAIPERIDRRNDITLDRYNARWDHSHCTSMKKDHGRVKKEDVLQWQADFNLFLPEHCLPSMVQGPILLFIFGCSLDLLKPTVPRYKKRRRK